MKLLQYQTDFDNDDHIIEITLANSSFQETLSLSGNKRIG